MQLLVQTPSLRPSLAVSQRGFTLVELIAIMVILGILSVSAVKVMVPSTTMQLQSSRDSIVAAFHSAQQLAMARQDAVTLTTSSGAVNIQLNGADATVGGVQYPIPLVSGQTLTSASFNFDRLGYTQADNLQLSQNGQVVTITIEATGYVH